MKTKIYVWWIKLQANRMPWTKLYKYRVREWERMKDTNRFLNGFWCADNKGNLEQKINWEAIKQMVEKLDD